MAATSALFVLDIKGRCLISRDYRHNVSTAQVETFFSKLLGREEFTLTAEFKLPSVLSEDAADRKAPITVRFEIPYFTVSGIQIRYLKIIEKSGYQALPWVRYITIAGDYELRLI